MGAMVKRIDSLTDEQRARIPEWRDKWIAIGLRTGETDKARFERCVADCYRATNLAPPKKIIYVGSPFALALAAPTAALSIETGIPPQDIPDDQLRDYIRKHWAALFGGQFWVGGWYWGSPAYVSFFTDICELELPEKIRRSAEAYRGSVESACWWWPHSEFVVVSERPQWIDRDEQGRLHSVTRRAIQWPDGWGLYRIHGVAVPEELVTNPGGITIASIDAERNAELRRVRLEIFGLQRYVRESASEVLDRDVDQYGRPRRLLRHAGMVFCEVTNSTPEPDGTYKPYLLPVHPQLCPVPPIGSSSPLGAPQKMTCRNAVASTFYLRGEEYRPELET
jgi:hypothetical protein